MKRYALILLTLMLVCNGYIARAQDEAAPAVSEAEAAPADQAPADQATPDQAPADKADTTPAPETAATPDEAPAEVAKEQAPGGPYRPVAAFWFVLPSR